MYTSHDFEGMPVQFKTPHQTVKAKPGPCFLPKCPSNRLQIMHVNVGGIQSDRVREIAHWATLHGVDLIVLTETRWSFTSDWTLPNWHVSHSGTKMDRADGIMILVHHRVCTAAQLGLAEVMPGRIMHLRIHFAQRCFDLLGCYQYSDNRTSARMKQRSQFWTRLSEYIAGLPNRNSVLIAGDFNCALTPDGHHVGTSSFTLQGITKTGPPHADSEHLQAILSRFNLTAVNCWNARDPPTFVNGWIGSKIDHFLMRHADCDSFCKKVVYYPEAGFLPATGAHHIPMVCSIRKIPYVFTRAAGMQSCSFSQRLSCRWAWQMHDDTWISFRTESDNLFHSFPSVSQPDDNFIDELHQHMMPTFQPHFPKLRPAPASDHPNAPVLLTKWDHRRKLQQPTRCNLPAIFRMWYHWAKFHRLKQQQAAHAKALKKRQTQDLIADAQQAAARHDSFGLYQLIAKYSPKQPRRRIRLRSTNGQPASAIEALEMTKQYVQTLWRGPAQVDYDRTTPTGIPFSLDELIHELEHIPAVKAVAKPYLPGLFWKCHATQTACILYHNLERWWNNAPIFVPPQWKKAWLTFLPKPHRSPSCLANLRPIALQEPLGKAVLGLVMKHFLQEITPFLVGSPQYAYIMCRSALDAIRRVAIHCNAVRTMLTNQRRSVHQRWQGHACFQTCGGIQIFLDVSKAFDMISRGLLFRYLRGLPICQKLVSLLAEWHSHASYLIFDGSAFSEVPVGKGVRQGCRAAPILWSCFTQMLFDILSDTIDAEWVREAITMFADDLHCGQIFHSPQELTTSMTRIGQLLDGLESLGLEISYSKSVILITIGGTNCRRLRHQIIQQGSDGPYVSIPRQNGTFSCMPVRITASYLGVQMNYRNYEEQTLAFRLKQAKNSFSRLRKWLCSRRLAFGTKLQIWRSCVFSTLIYGLYATDITFPGIRLLHTQIMNHYRKLAGDHSYVTGKTHHQFLVEYRLDHPIGLLIHGALQLQQLQRRRLTQLYPHDIILHLDWTTLDSTINLLHTAWMAQANSMDSPMPPPDAEVQPFQYVCQVCTKSFDSLPNLRRHHTKEHGLIQYRNLMVHALSYAQGGLPHCSHCQMQFTSWRSFCHHIERNCCEARPTSQRGLAPLTTEAQDRSVHPSTAFSTQLLHRQSYGPALLSLISRKAWHELREMEDAKKDLSAKCVLCGMFTGRIQDLHFHLRTHHPDCIPFVFAKMSQLCRAQTAISPCAFCGKTFQRTHSCPVMCQVALLMINLSRQVATPGSIPPVVLNCEVCLTSFASVQELTKHLTSYHKLEINDWAPARDMQNNDPVCAHCLKCFTQESALRQHIARGQCAHFDPMRTPDEPDIPDHLRQVLLDGNVESLLEAPATRLKLTQTCQLCGTTFARQGDLVLHLQTVHSSRWHKASASTNLLLRARMQQDGCYCNPSPNLLSTAHVCPLFRQLALLEQKLDHDLFLPWRFTVEGIREFLRQHDPAFVAAVTSVLLQRQFADLWTDPQLTALLGSTCLICGGRHHSAVLCEHIKSMHSQHCVWIPELLPQLLPKFQQTASNDFQCDWCHQVYNLPIDQPDATADPQREILAQIHYQHHCPVLYQVGLLLTHGLSRNEWGRDGGSRHAVHSSLQGTGTPDAGPIHSAEGRRKRRKKAAETTNRAGQQSCNQAPSLDGQHGAEDGCGAANSEKTRLLDLLHAKRTAFPPGQPGDTSTEVARGDQGAQEDTGVSGDICTIEATPVQAHSGASQGSDSATGQSAGPHERSSLEDVSGTWADPSRWKLPVPPMATSTTGIGAHEEGSNPHAEDASVHGSDARVDLRSQCSDEVPRHDKDGHPTDHTLAPADLSTPGRTSSSIGHTTGIHGMGIGWGGAETSHAPPEQAGTTTPGAAGEGQREDTFQIIPRQGEEQVNLQVSVILRLALASACLGNDANWCYINATFLATMWAFLCNLRFPDEFWGPQADELTSSCVSLASAPAMLCDFPWMAALLRSWGDTSEQGDAVEFLQHMLRGLNFAGFTFQWERRVQLGLLTSVRDQNDETAPIVLHVDPALETDGRIRLRDLIQAWHDHMGMRTALTSPTDLICVHINRFVHSGDGQVYKSDLSVGFHWGCSFPCFDGPTLDVTWKDYQIVSAIAHQGVDQAGHYRSWLNVEHDVRAGLSPTLALLTNDNHEAVRIWHEPDWFAQNVVCLWLCSCEMLNLCRLPTTFCNPELRTGPASSGIVRQARSDLLSLFQAREAED